MTPGHRHKIDPAVGWISFTDILLLLVLVLFGVKAMNETAAPAPDGNESSPSQRDSQPRLVAQVAELTGEVSRIEEYRSSYECVLSAMESLKVAAGRQFQESRLRETALERRWSDYKDAVFAPVQRARLVVSLSSGEPMPEGVDLDLFVQDPLGRICCPLEPSVWDGLSETGILMQSQDLKLLDSGTQQEIFYSSKPISAEGRSYLVFGMLRESGATGGKRVLNPGKKIDWNVELKDSGRTLLARSGSFLVPSTGFILDKESKVRSSVSFRLLDGVFPHIRGLYPLCEFTVSTNRAETLVFKAVPSPHFYGFVAAKAALEGGPRIESEIRSRQPQAKSAPP